MALQQCAILFLVQSRWQKLLLNAGPTYLSYWGVQASSVPNTLLNSYPFIWSVVVGEAENIICDLWDDLAHSNYQHRPGVIWSPKLSPMELTSYTPPALPDLNAIPFLDIKDYPPASTDRGLMLDVGRGCPYSCTFCTTNDFFRRRYRMKCKERITEEIQRAREHPHIVRVDFVHDMFTANPRLVRDICNHLIADGVIMTWGCSTRTDSVSSDLLELMVRAGCDDIFFGLETGSQRLQI